MKNDVVRWSRQPNSNINNNSSCSNSSSSSINCNVNNKHNQQGSIKNNALHKVRQHVVSRRTFCQPKSTPASVAATISSLQQGQQQEQQTIVECDITNFNFNCNLLKNSFLTHNKTKRIRNRHPECSTATPTATRTWSLTATSPSTAMLLILQFSIVVFLCNLNVGFAAKVEPGHAQSPLLPPYILDYEKGAASSSSSSGSPRSGRAAGGDAGHYTHTWAVHIPNGDNNGIADAVAKEHGFVNLGKIFDDHYHFAHHKVSKRSLTPATHHQTRLDLDERVHWAKQQRAKSRSKRDFIRMRPSRTSSRALSLVDVMTFDDPKWPQMWYLNRGGDLDMNVIPAWQQGITGKGVVVTILDDGLESDHPDIEQNYDPKASYDVNSHDDDPMPHYDMTDSNRHGTRCAGEVAATANNSFCAVGIAYGASVGGVRMLDGDVTDAVEARSLSLNPQHIDIYSASWGPDDDGKTVDGPGELASRAFIEGTTKGRGGKGSIFIWASGNGGREMDNCNCDGYTNSIWTLSISSATEEGNVPWYSEKCSSTLATTYSSGGQSEKQVVTTDLHHSCTVSHTGTSASAPLAAGIAALVLQSNQNLTWRDLQHIVVRTAKPANLKDSSWSRNGVGRRVSHSFGYGLMDAAEMVRVARNWKTVPEQQRCEINAPHVDKVIPPRTHITLQLSVNHCLSVNYLEHVQAKITLTSQRRGDIQLYLKSPANTKVTLLTSRMHDNSRSGFNQWPFMSVHTWGESPHGNWQLEIHNEGRYMGHALLREWSLIFYGTTLTIDPNDPISVARASSGEQATTPNSSTTSSTTSNLHQIYSPQYPRISPNNFAQASAGGAKLPLGKMPPNKSNLVTNNPLLPLPPAPPAKQGYQQISATYGVILGKTNNNNSNNNNNNKGNNKGNNKANKANKAGEKNGNGKTNKKEQAAQNSSSSNIGNQGSNKNKYYRISQQHGGGGGGGGKSKGQANGLQTQRPKASSSEKYYEEKTRKVIGEITTSNNNNNNNNNRGSNSSTAPRLPVKAAKQVKDSSPDSRIPKLFEHYDKIQAIFPELEPYESSSLSKSKPGMQQQQQQQQKQQSPRKQGKQFEVELFRPTTGGAAGSNKPGNTKKSPSAPPPPSQPILPAGGSSFLPDQRILKKQQLLMAAAGVLTPQNGDDDMSANDEEDDSEEGILQLAPSSFGKSSAANAQITQWDMILYGTEVPAQPKDQIHENQQSQFNVFGNDMAHNDIEHDASGQWRNMQQVGEVGMTQDRSNAAACLKWSDQKCLDCREPSFFYMDLCYDECPQHTFAQVNSDELDEEVTLSDIDAAVAISTPDGNDLPSTGKSSINQDDPLQAAERRRRSSDSSTSTLLLTPRQSRICSSCDKSCLRCYGPNASQCSTCYPGNQLRKLLQTNETYCYAYVVRSTVVDVSNPANAQLASDAKIQYMNWSTALLVIAVVVSLVGMGVAGGIVYNRRAAKAELYTRVALIAEDDSDEEQEVEVFKAHLHYPSDVLEYHDELQPNQLPRESLDAALQDEEHAQLVPE
ncbi:furin-like protease 1, isoforms 1/1-X/2 isoform X1 [Drosophila virilis]|uniref:furin-like protease 1, isoforms 1/1-X/2 isoform X1 n=1 Tax=Drosophila virilis TaxID=7244 RepID=UPI0013961CC6|nr:furin-like protease 1 isoform X1 [Drosophila virilis]XP_032289721.1 furin-like protease 1 isoform X1 [Drosophila virilis]